MSDNYQYPKGTQLNPPITYDGEVYSYGFLFDAMPSNNNEGYPIVHGKIVSVQSMGSGLYQIVCERGTQLSSYPVSLGAGQGSIEVTTYHSAGGNIAASREIDRVRSYINEPMASMGSLEAIRAVAGDGLQITRAGKKYLWEIISATAYSEAPTEVNYNGDIPLPTVGYITSDVNNIYLTQDIGSGTDSYYDGTTIIFDETFDQSKYFCALYFIHSGVFTLGERVYKTSPLPADFGDGLTGPKYYYDAYQFKLISDCLTYGPDGYLLTWMLRDANLIQALPSASYLTLQTEQVSTFLLGGDSCLLSGTPVLKEFDLAYEVYHPGCVQWRTDTNIDARSIRMEFDKDGNLTAYKRDAIGGIHSSLFVTQASSYTYPFQVRIVKSGTGITFYSRQNGAASWEPNATSTFTGLSENIAGAAGISPTTEDILYSVLQTQDTTLIKIGDARGTTYLYRYKLGTFDVVREYPRPSSEAITDVYNVTANQSMTSSGPISRLRYSLGTNTIYLPSETAGDQIRITCAAPATVPPPPGNAPRTYLQPHFAEFGGDPDNPQKASSNIINNKANWRDSLIIRVEDAGWTPVVGEEFVIIRGRGVWSTSHIPTVYIDYRNDDNTDWQVLSPSNYHLRAYQGLLLIRQSFMGTITKPFCLKIEGRRYRSGADADVYNEIKHGIEMMDNLYFECGIAGGNEAMSPSGLSSGMTVGYGAWSCGCDGDVWVPGSAAYGTRAETIRISQTGTGINGGHRIPPYWDGYGGGTWTTTRQGTVIIDDDPDWLQCNPPSGPGRGEYDYVVPEEEYIWVSPYSPSLGADLIRPHWTREHYRITGYVGDIPIVDSDPAPDFRNYMIGYVGLAGSFAANTISSGFAFNAIPVSIPPQIQRLPDGCTIIDARMRVRYEGMRQRTLSGSMSIGTDGDEVYWDYYEQGVLCLQYHRYRDANGAIVEDTNSNHGLWPEPTKGGSVGFQLVGQRKNTRYVQDWAGNDLGIPDGELYSLGGTIASDVEDGKWSIIDATGLIRAMYHHRGGEYSNYWLYPTNAQVDSDDGVGAMASYVASLTPTHSASLLTGDDCSYGYTCTASGRVTWWSSLEIGSVHIRYRLGDGVIQAMVLPFLQPKHIRY
jgi:hypothetical protein